MPRRPQINAVSPPRLTRPTNESWKNITTGQGRLHDFWQAHRKAKADIGYAQVHIEHDLQFAIIYFIQRLPVPRSIRNRVGTTRWTHEGQR